MFEELTSRAEDIYYSALQIKASDERKVYLDDACAGDSGLRAVVDKLLDSKSRSEIFFQEGGLGRFPVKELSQFLEETPGLADNLDALAKEDEFLGKLIGPYKLLQRIGEGGCGVVYMADQEKPVRRRVALKVIKLGMDTKSVVARFEAERQALALMDHPNIARVLDAGATDTGRPYFVMELVRGVKITEYCDQNKLDTQERLKLFIQVCQAIQHAHQKGVIHRDIKPSNILVTIIDGMAVPKVIDFGIAKAIEGRLTDNTIFTAYEQFVGTPAYMSPEQAVMSGVDVDTRSDIYSLGVLLYELLTGRTPFETRELMQNGLDGLRRTLQEREPQRPSVVLTTMQGSALDEMARCRQAAPVNLISMLRGDLDWIVIRALEKDRARRYQTANGLAMDIQRYMANEPVFARPPSRLYRFQKLVRRNKGVFAAAGAVMLALILGLSLSTWFWLREREARRLAEAAEQQQASLRIEAENREWITQAAFAISRGQLAEADALVNKVSGWKPSLEAESVLRALGEWHALQGHWDQAANRFSLLLAADQSDNSWAITQDLLMAGPIQIERGDIQGYEHFRRAAIARFMDAPDPVFAERTMKISLLLPAATEVMKSLEPMNELSANSMENTNQDPIMAAWRCISLSLMAYREGYTPTAEMWCTKCLGYPENNPARIATAHIIQSMACYQLGESDKSKVELEQGRKMVETEFSGGLTTGNGGLGFWFDWLFARILLHEAEGMMVKPSA